MLTRILAACAVLSALPAAAVADTAVSPGLWSYQASYGLGPIPMRDEGSQCVSAEMASKSYEALLNDINPNCSVTSSSQQADGFHFSMQCSGGPEGELDGRLIASANEASLNATGWTGTSDNAIPVILSAFATRISPNCS